MPEVAQGQAPEQPYDVNQAALALIEKEEKQATSPEEPEKAPEPVKEEVKPETETEVQAEIRRHKLKVKNEEGKEEEVEVDDDELKRGYMKDRDYRAKTALLAREREQIQEKVKQQIDPALSHYKQNLEFFEKALWKSLAPEMESVDWNALARDNPAEWAAKMQAVNNVNGLLQAVKQEQEKISKQQDEQIRATMQRQVQETVETLKRDIPGWNNDIYQSILEAGTKYGYTREELNAVADARAIKVLNDAMQYRKLQEAKPAMEKKVVDVPKVMKPGTANKPDQNRDEFKSRMDQLRKGGGRMEDAHRAAMLLIK